MSTVTVPKYSSGAHDTSSRSTGPSSTKCWNTTRGIAQPHRRYRGLRTGYLCDNRIKSIGTRFFFAPLCEDPDMCRDADMCEDPDDYGTPTVHAVTRLRVLRRSTRLSATLPPLTEEQFLSIADSYQKHMASMIKMTVTRRHKAGRPGSSEVTM